jgi:hypothetical protein
MKLFKKKESISDTHTQKTLKVGFPQGQVSTQSGVGMSGGVSHLVTPKHFSSISYRLGATASKLSFWL